MTEHSEQAKAAYPDNQRLKGGMTISTLDNDEKRTAFDRGMAERRITDRETLARTIWTRTIGDGDRYPWDEAIDQLGADHRRFEQAWNIADAILALPSTPFTTLEVLTLHTSAQPDMETVARLQNEGYNMAMAQNLADDPALWDEWLADKEQAARDEVIAAVANWGADDQGVMPDGLYQVLLDAGMADEMVYVGTPDGSGGYEIAASELDRQIRSNALFVSSRDALAEALWNAHHEGNTPWVRADQEERDYAFGRADALLASGLVKDNADTPDPIDKRYAVAMDANDDFVLSDGSIMDRKAFHPYSDIPRPVIWTGKPVAPVDRLAVIREVIDEAEKLWPIFRWDTAREKFGVIPTKRKRRFS